MRKCEVFRIEYNYYAGTQIFQEYPHFYGHQSEFTQLGEGKVDWITVAQTQMPSTEAEWQAVSGKFVRHWHFPKCCGAIDGKHIAVKRPANSGSTFHNYKGFYSIILLAVVDAKYNFVYVNVGANGRAGDAGVFNQSTLFYTLENRERNGTCFPSNHVILGDDAFPLKTYLMKPYSHLTRSIKERIFNYQLSRARNKVENAFGILATRFRIFLRPMDVKPGTADKVIWAACTLHNWLRRTSGKTYIPRGAVDYEDEITGELIEGSWRKEVTNPLPSVRRLGSNNFKKDAEDVRSEYARLFTHDFVIPWQWKRIGLTEAPTDEDLLADMMVEEEEE